MLLEWYWNSCSKRDVLKYGPEYKTFYWIVEFWGGFFCLVGFFFVLGFFWGGKGFVWFDLGLFFCLGGFIWFLFRCWGFFVLLVCFVVVCLFISFLRSFLALLIQSGIHQTNIKPLHHLMFTYDLCLLVWKA